MPLNFVRTMCSHFGLLAEELRQNISESSAENRMDELREGLVMSKQQKTFRFALIGFCFLKKSGTIPAIVLELLTY